MGRAGNGLGQSEGGEWPVAAWAGLRRRPAATGRRVQGGTGRGVTEDAGVSGALAFLRISSVSSQQDSIERALLNSRAIAQSETPFHQIVRESIRHKRRAAKKKNPGRYGGTGRGEHLMRLGGLSPASARTP